MVEVYAVHLAVNRLLERPVIPEQYLPIRSNRCKLGRSFRFDDPQVSYWGFVAELDIRALNRIRGLASVIHRDDARFKSGEENVRIFLTELDTVYHSRGLEDKFWCRGVIDVKYVGVHGGLNALTIYFNLRNIFLLESLAEHGDKLLGRSVNFWLEDETIKWTLYDLRVLEHRYHVQGWGLWDVLQSWVVKVLSRRILGVVDVEVLHRDSRLHLHSLDVAGFALCLFAESQYLLLFFHSGLVQDLFLKHGN